MTGLYNRTLPLQRATRVPDGQGGFTETFSTVGHVTCRVTPISAAELIQQGRDTQRIAYRVSCDASTDIRVNDRVINGAAVIRIDAVPTTSSGRRKQCIGEEIS
ncbi:MAG: head-tail adaptor protein [Pseudomonadota bacterium]